MRTKRWISALLSVLMILSAVHIETFAAKFGNNIILRSGSSLYINPLYPDTNAPKHSPIPDAGTWNTEEVVTCPSIEDAAAFLRKAMESRTEIVTFSYPECESEAMIEELFDKIRVSAFAHTGVPTQGDYLLFQFSSIATSWSYYVNSDGSVQDIEITYLISYLTSAEQEAELDVAVDELLSELNLTDKTDYEKVCGIYDYICKNVIYGNEQNSSPLMSTAYAALINCIAVSHGYSTLFYRLALELGVDTRIISGNADGPRLWNIVDMGEKFYYLDPSRDAGRSNYNYFLLGSNRFYIDHMLNAEYLTEEFLAEHPIDTDNYVHPIPDEPEDLTEIIAGGNCGENLIWTLTSNGTLTISGEGAMNSNEWNTYSDSIVNVIIEAGVTNINTLAFSDCYALELVTIPNSITNIESNVFSNCNSLSNIYYNGTVEQWECTQIHANNDILFTAELICTETKPEEQIIDSGICGDNLSWSLGIDGTLVISGRGDMFDFDPSQTPWQSCKGDITELVIGHTVTGIGDYAFMDCDNLTLITIRHRATDIGCGAFSDCSGVESIVLPEKASIGAYAFKNCTNLTSITIPDSVTHIGNGAFSNCQNLANIALPKNLTEISTDMFSGCTSLVSIELPAFISTIKEGAFRGCTGLVSFKIPEDVATIGERAFAGCTGLESIRIPRSVTTIENNAFSDCLSLATVTYVGTAEQWNNVQINSGNNYLLDADIICTDGPVVIDSGTCGELLIWTLTEDGVLTISGEGAMDQFEDTNLPGAAPWVRHSDQIRSLVIGNGITSIGSWAFSGLQIKDIMIPDSVTYIDRNAFAQCSALTNLIIPENVVTIGDQAFSNCSALKNVTIGNSVTSIGKNTFESCYSLEIVIIGNSVTTIGNGAFYNCTNLQGVKIPDRVTSIGEFAFYNCTNLAGLEISKNVTIIEQFTFWGCVDLFNVTLPDGITTLGTAAFNGCSSLAKIIIPSSLTNIDQSVFSSCNSLKTVYFTGTEAQWDTIEIDAYNDRLLKATFVYLFNHSHTEEVIPKKDASCTETGLTEGKKCSVCGEILLEQEETPALEHQYTTYTSNGDATCEADGTKSASCDHDCGAVHTVTDEGSKLEHQYTIYTSNNDATCEADGTKSASCDHDCGAVHTVTDEGTLLGHDYDDGVITTVPTCTEKGIRRYSCKRERCNHSYTEEIEALDHTEEVVPAKEPTLMEHGLTEGKRCTTCGKTLLEQEEIPVLESISGTCGDALTWTLTKDGVLTISGTGAMYNFKFVIDLIPQSVIPMNTEDLEPAPWADYHTLIVKVVIKDGVTSIGDNAFAACTELKEIEIPETLTEIGDGVFLDCEALETIIYSGNKAQWNEIEIGADNAFFEESVTVILGILLGDVNDDGRVTGADTNLIFRYVSGTVELTEEQLKAADVNGDGRVTGADTNLVFRFVSGTLDSLG